MSLVSMILSGAGAWNEVFGLFLFFLKVLLIVRQMLLIPKLRAFSPLLAFTVCVGYEA